MKTAIFAAGCFWGVEITFRKLAGVLDTEVGYSGGHLLNPTYNDVCSGTTGHAEAIRLQFEPDVISYAELLAVFWKCHDPTTLHRQGLDVGSQYRSVIFYSDEAQYQAALESKAQLDADGVYPNPIMTEIVSVVPFFRAEEYHQRYLER